MTAIVLIGLGLIGMLFAALSFVFWIWMLISAITNPRIGGGEKIAWVLVIILLNLLGALIYCVVGKSRS
jgi:hypothetical protein